MKKKVTTIENLLRVGRENAIGWQRLVDMMELKSRRELYRVIAEARSRGAIILSNQQGGYYLPDTTTDEGRSEMAHFVARFSGMAKSVMMAQKSARANLKNVRGQMSFE